MNPVFYIYTKYFIVPDSCFSCLRSTGGCSVLSLSSRFPPYIYEVFSCVASCASSVLSLCVSSVPVSSPFCNPCRPLHVLRSNSFRCSIASSILSLCVPLFQLYPSFLSRYLLLFYSLCPFPLISPLCTPPDTCPIFSLCVFCPDTSSSLSSFLPFLFSVLGLSVSPYACFQPRCPHLPGAIPPFSPPPFPPLPPSFPRFPSPILRSFPLLRFPLRKKFPLKSRVISSVKYMFYSIFLVCLGKFS